MAFELIYTSTPRGLVPGSYGFCVVARSRAMSERVAVVLKELSGYRRIAGATPVAYSHFVFDDGGRGVRAIARIADAGLDYSNRTNQIAHFITLDGNDLVPCGPAELCAANPPLFQRRWDAPPQWFEAPTPVHNRVEPRFQSSEWQNLLGDLGWAGALASTVKTGQSVAIVARPEQNVLRLFQESIYLLEPSQRWKATFSTYYTKAPGNVLIQWKTVFAGTPEEAAFRATPNCLLIDLANPSRVGAPERFHGSPECARLVERARRELLRAPEPVASPGAIPNLATAGAANAYDVGPTPIYGQSSSPGQPDFRGLNPQDQGVYAVRQPVPSQGAPSVPRKGGKKVLNYGRPAPGTQGPSITPRREKKDGSKSLIWALVGAIVALTLALAIVLAVKSDVSDLVKWTKNWFAHPQEIVENAAPDAGNKPVAETVKDAANAAPASPRQPAQPEQPKQPEGEKVTLDAGNKSATPNQASQHGGEEENAEADDVVTSAYETENEAANAPAPDSDSSMSEEETASLDDEVTGNDQNSGTHSSGATSNDGTMSDDENDTNDDSGANTSNSSNSPKVSDKEKTGTLVASYEKTGGVTSGSNTNQTSGGPDKNYFTKDSKWGFIGNDDKNKGVIYFPKHKDIKKDLKGKKALVFELEFKNGDKSYRLGNECKDFDKESCFAYFLSPNQENKRKLLAIIEANKTKVNNVVLIDVDDTFFNNFKIESLLPEFIKLENKKSNKLNGILGYLERKDIEVVCTTYGIESVELSRDENSVVWNPKDAEALNETSKKVGCFFHPSQNGQQPQFQDDGSYTNNDQ